MNDLIIFTEKKFEAFNCLQVFKELTENEIDMKIKCLRLDNGREFVSNEFNNYCDENHIKIHFTKTPEQNGVVETPEFFCLYLQAVSTW